MSDDVLVAIIGASAVIISAVIGVFAAKAKSGNRTTVKQKAKGKKEAMQIGVVNINVEEKKDSERKS